MYFVLSIGQYIELLCFIFRCFTTTTIHQKSNFFLMYFVFCVCGREGDREK